MMRNTAIGAALLLCVAASMAREIEDRECWGCHDGRHSPTNGPAVNRRDYARSAHRDNTCVSCHSDVTELPHPKKLKAVDCEGCHDTSANSIRLSAHGRAAQRGHPRAPSCAACHGVHDIPRSDPEAFVRGKLPWSSCRKCHRGVEARLIAREIPIHVPASAGREQPAAVQWVRRFYVAIIVVITMLMALHNLLDGFAKLRRRRPPATEAGEIRLTVWMRVQHGMLIVLFVILVATGFAHKWHGASGSAGLHHGAGIFFVALFLAHVVTMLGTRQGRLCLKELRPTRQDCRDLIAAIKHNLGRGPSPAPRRWSYVEKIEYWAALTGSFVISVTGLIMLNAETVLRFVSVLWCDIAWTIHYYEAWLAVLSVLVWHLYAVMLNPDVFPMNPAWLTGRRLTRRGNDATGAHGQ